MRPILDLIIKNGRGETVAELSLQERASSSREHPREPTRPRNSDWSVTEPQRRMLFRLAASLGYEGDVAREYIDRRLGSDPDRRAASQLIDDLQLEVKRSGVRDERAS